MGCRAPGVAQLMGSGLHCVVSYAKQIRKPRARVAGRTGLLSLLPLQLPTMTSIAKTPKGYALGTRHTNTQAYGRTFLIQTIILPHPFLFSSEITRVSLEILRSLNFLPLLSANGLNSPTVFLLVNLRQTS